MDECPMDNCLYGLLTAWTIVRMDDCPHGRLSVWTIVRMDDCPHGQLSAWTIVRMDDYPLAINVDKKSIEEVSLKNQA